MAKRKVNEPIFEPIEAPKRHFELIEASIRREIYNGSLVPGQKLPNEFELARQFNVGRSAVREALKVLELAGLLFVRRGYNGGTFVTLPDFEEASEAITLTFKPGNMALDQSLDPLGAASVLAARSENLASVALTMAAFGLGAALPLLAIGMMSREALVRWRDRMLSAGRGGKAALGALLIVMGLLIVSGFDKRIETALVDVSPGWLTELTTRF